MKTTSRDGRLLRRPNVPPYHIVPYVPDSPGFSRRYACSYRLFTHPRTFPRCPVCSQRVFVGRVDLSVAQLVEYTREGGGVVRDAAGAKTIKMQHIPLKDRDGAKNWRSNIYWGWSFWRRLSTVRIMFFLDFLKCRR